ncbi:uncharacterized protein LOC107882574 [Acyrthosiphon pisum]|uniref:MULE transposase domain-containing protein n=1 Tax=Acyrthosiphon pisum TaxID=7029 RepID=A0A8R2JPS4_ACYPI|nr:uncharacterized protein LOC107882574 [Acyrthosiphon pisum]XP_029343771.1 uncharacterized protein LOC107882574 [Acyrthosiphon pisum]
MPLMNAVQTVMPETKLMGCWFHFCQAVIRYSKRKLNSVYHLFQSSPIAARVLRMVLALPHLPADRGHPDCPQHDINDGFRAIINYVQQVPDIEQHLRTFLIGYVERYWLSQIVPKILSIFVCEYRTNNYLESFHSVLLTQMSKHPNI